MTATTTSPKPAATPMVATDDRDPLVRLDDLFQGTAVPLMPPDESGVSAASGVICGRQAVAFCTDPRIKGGALGADGCTVIDRAYQVALQKQAPIVGVWHSGGARLAEGVLSLDAIGRMFRTMTLASGTIPQLSVVLGPAAGGAAYGPALTDIVIGTEESRLFVTGPGVIQTVTGEEVTMEDLGGPAVHARESGVMHIRTRTPREAYGAVRHAVGVLHDQPIQEQPVDDLDLGSFLPSNPRRAYEVHPLVENLLDARSLLVLQAEWAPNLLTGLGTLGGASVGVIANNPLRLGGCLESRSAEKAARFVRMCDAFGVPLLVLVDVPGYLPGSSQESEGVLRRGAKLLHAFAGSTVPRATLITRKAYGGAYLAMNGRSLGADRVFAWPAAELAVMSTEAAVRVLHRKTLAAAPDEHAREQAFRDLCLAHERESGGLRKAVETGVVDQIVEPSKTRTVLASWLRDQSHRRRRGDQRNIPL